MIFALKDEYKKREVEIYRISGTVEYTELITAYGGLNILSLDWKVEVNHLSKDTCNKGQGRFYDLIWQTL